MTYHQLTPEDRYTLSALRKEGRNQSEIALRLGRHRSTISRELKRNSNSKGVYRPSKAIARTNGRRSRSRRNQQFSMVHYRAVDVLIRKQWSPEQVCGYLRQENILSISHETIYRHIWNDRRSGGDLHEHLRGSRKRMRKQYGSRDGRGRLAGKRHISERPESIEKRGRVGHWEIDTVMGSINCQQCVVTIVERKTGFVLIGKLQRRTAKLLNQATLRLARRSVENFLTITADNGTEFHSYKDLEKALNIKFYFATPHHAWERGTNENTNGLIRQYLPKGQSMAHVTQRDCNVIAKKLNTRPRKRLDFRTPEECFYRRQ